MTFKELNISSPILRALEDKQYAIPTPIQEQAIPIATKGVDVLGLAQTGTGKTAAFAIPIIDQLKDRKFPKGAFRPIRSLILTPTRELALQIEESFLDYGKYTDLRYTVIFGGVNQNPQVRQLKRGTDILVATPGRLLAQTGTGKTAAFAIPIIDQLKDRRFPKGAFRPIRSLILTPTRELALQIEESFLDYGKYTDLRYTVIFGGVN